MKTTLRLRLWDHKAETYVVRDAELTIDVEALVDRLAAKAMLSKTRRATAFFGNIVVKVLK